MPDFEGRTVANGTSSPESPWLERVSVEGFQGNRKFSFPLSQHANFLIGRNGCGKTTLINLINAGLAGDSATLARAPFEKLELHLTNGTETSGYNIVYRRLKSGVPQYSAIEVSLFGPRGGKLIKEVFHNRERYLYRDGISNPYMYESPNLPLGSILDRKNKARPVTTWLSVLRADLARPQGPESSQQNPLDRKIEELTTRTSRFLSSLDTRASVRSAQFQKDYFLSLIGFSGEDLWSRVLRSFSDLDLNNEEKNLGKILSHLKLKPADYEEKLKIHFDTARAVNPPKNLSLHDAVAMIDTFRIHELNEKWLAFERDRADIYAPKRIFIEIMNSLISGKQSDFNDRNQLIYKLDPKTLLEPSGLSSGEKQLFIILTEALVQEGRRAIYLADEPELSLHVDWQQFLVENILKLNERCQVIFATHSPDILGPYGEAAINVERL